MEQKVPRVEGFRVPTLETERLRLRDLRGSDFEDYARMYAEPEAVRFLATGETWGRARAWRHMAMAVGHWQLNGAGVWVAEEKGSGAFVGMIGFWEPETWPGFELTWHLAPKFWGRGYACEGARAALAHAFLVWRRDRVMSLVHPPNLRSVRVAERIGERLDGLVDHLGSPVLTFGIDRETYLREVAPAAVTAPRADERAYEQAGVWRLDPNLALRGAVGALPPQDRDAGASWARASRSAG